MFPANIDYAYLMCPGQLDPVLVSSAKEMFTVLVSCLLDLEAQSQFYWCPAGLNTQLGQSRSRDKSRRNVFIFLLVLVWFLGHLVLVWFLVVFRICFWLCVKDHCWKCSGYPM